MSVVLAPEWQVWVAGNLIRGRPAEEIVAVLVAQGLAPEHAMAEVEALAASPGVVAAKDALKPAQLANRLRRAHLRLGSREVAVRDGISGREFVDVHVAAQVPVILPHLTADWPARRWTWEHLVERFGEVDVQVCERRLGAVRPERRFADHVANRRFRDVVARVLDPTTGNDLYLVANNKAIEGPLSGLLDDVRPTAGFLDPARLGTSSVLIGPAGASTPLHHDTCDILFCQFLGRKRVLLAPPEEIELADHGAGFWCDLDLDAPEGLAEAGLEGAAIREVVVRPGEALLIPSGWWHQVVSLDPGVTLTFAGLVHRNDYTWFRPCPPERGS